MTFKRVKLAARAGQVAQHGRSGGDAFKLVTGLVHRKPGDGSKDQHLP